MSCEKVLYEELKPCEFKERLEQAPIAYIPLGTLEWHGEHMPLGADGIQSQMLFENLAKEVGGIVLPKLYLGPDEREVKDGQELYGMELFRFSEDHPAKPPHKPLLGSCYWVEDEVFEKIIDATLKQLCRAGFKIAVGHGHGPSTIKFRSLKEKMLEKYNIKCFDCFVGTGGNYLEEGYQVDHAGINETSIVMYFRPELVDLGKLPENKDEWPLATGPADPRESCAATGKKAFNYTKSKMAELLKKELTKLK